MIFNFVTVCRKCSSFSALSTAFSLTCIQRGGGLAQAGLPLPLGRAQNLQSRTNFRASYCPACAKPLVTCWRYYLSEYKSFFLIIWFISENFNKIIVAVIIVCTLVVIWRIIHSSYSILYFVKSHFFNSLFR